MLSKDSALNHDMGSIPTISFPNLTAAKEQSPPLKPEDINWLNALENIVGQCIGDFGFNLDRLSQEIYLSPRQTRRRLKNLIGLSFSQYVKTMRMAKAYQLLQNGSVKSIRGLAYDCY